MVKEEEEELVALLESSTNRLAFNSLFQHRLPGRIVGKRLAKQNKIPKRPTVFQNVLVVLYPAAAAKVER
ncbi:hypothetical protein M513_09103, partial [Trichuris suis]